MPVYMPVDQPCHMAVHGSAPCHMATNVTSNSMHTLTELGKVAGTLTVSSHVCLYQNFAPHRHSSSQFFHQGRPIPWTGICTYMRENTQAVRLLGWRPFVSVIRKCNPPCKHKQQSWTADTLCRPPRKANTAHLHGCLQPTPTQDVHGQHHRHCQRHSRSLPCHAILQLPPTADMEPLLSVLLVGVYTTLCLVPPNHIIITPCCVPLCIPAH
eukprot:scaffold14940_cov17-Tisochrysis_lutea.AAC.1